MKNHPETDHCGFDRNASISEDCYVCTCGYVDRETPNPRPSQLTEQVRGAIAAGPALLPPTHPEAIKYGKKRETAEEFAERVALLAISDFSPRPEAAQKLPPLPDEIQEWCWHMDLHVTEHDLQHAGKALRAAWPHISKWLKEHVGQGKPGVPFAVSPLVSITKEKS